ncbi:Alpha/Beta hydrolase protein [Pelagophyceae sp. CCMP2097]|nr:Alpha/Beta hydrolase protein [Pelagophyceae sp. CCMP2097]
MASTDAADGGGGAALEIDWATLRFSSFLVCLEYADFNNVGAFGGLERAPLSPKDSKDTKIKAEYESNTVYLSKLALGFPKAEVLQYLTNKKSLNCAVGKNYATKQVVVVFRGSKEPKDWVQDLWIFKTQKDVYHDSGHGKVHGGFYDQLHELDEKASGKTSYQVLEDLLDKELCEGWSVLVTGHSLGASLSTLASYELALKFPKHQFLVCAFASTKCGDAAFKEAYDALPNVRQYRICYGRDIVPGFPFGFGYCHVGDTLLYDKDAKPLGQWHYYPKAADDPDYYPGYCTIDPGDHDAKNYVDAVEQGLANKDATKFHSAHEPESGRELM